MPVLYLLAGPNGAGKTTFYDIAVNDGSIDPALPFINVDNITKGLGAYTEENFARAEDIYRDTVNKHIQHAESFMIESNLAKEADYTWIESMKRRGYEIILYFLGTNDVDENIARVNRRVKEGGHDIPAHIVTDRYRMGLIYLKSRLGLFKEVYLLDNTGSTVQQVAILKNGVLEYEAQHSLQWVQSVLYIVKRMPTK